METIEMLRKRIELARAARADSGGDRQHGRRDGVGVGSRLGHDRMGSPILDGGDHADGA